MFQRFLVPLDGSKRAEKAIPVAADLTRAVHGTLTLARIVEPSPGGNGEYEASLSANEIRAAQIALFAEAKSYLDGLLALYEQELDGLHLILDVSSGIVPSTLFSLANQEHLDMIVMCSRGESWLKRWVLGSVAQATLRRSPLPVLVLNEHGEDCSLFQNTRPLRILAPQDGSELSEAVLTSVFQLLGNVSPSTPHEIRLLRVLTMPVVAGGLGGGVYITDTFWEEQTRRAEQELQTLAQRLEQAKPKTVHCVITTSVVSGSDVAGAILGQAQPARVGNEGMDYDLIALTTHGRTGLKRLLLGSVTEQIFGATTLPLLVVHPSSVPSSEKQRREQEQERRAEIEQSWVGLF